MIATSCLLACFTCYFKELQDFPENFARDFCDPEWVKIYCALQPKNCCLSKRSGGASRGWRGFLLGELGGIKPMAGPLCRMLAPAWRAAAGLARSETPDFPTSGIFLPSTQRLA